MLTSTRRVQYSDVFSNWAREITLYQPGLEPFPLFSILSHGFGGFTEEDTRRRIMFREPSQNNWSTRGCLIERAVFTPCESSSFLDCLAALGAVLEQSFGLSGYVRLWSFPNNSIPRQLWTWTDHSSHSRSRWSIAVHWYHWWSRLASIFLSPEALHRWGSGLGTSPCLPKQRTLMLKWFRSFSIKDD